MKRKQPSTAEISATAFFLPSLAPKALGIYHPALAILGIKSVQVTDVSQFEQIVDGVWGCTIELIVSRPPLPLLFKPAGNIPPVAKKTPTARDALEEKIQKQLDNIDNLEKNLANTPPKP